jgi:Cof subfamily protein (haloacid dehalogenase superfamily)
MKKNTDNDLKKVKLIVFDMDGTLLTREGKVPENIVNSIKTLKNLGIYVTLASARVYTSMIKYAKLLDIDIPLISLDGALIKDKDGNIVLHQAPLKPLDVRKAIRMAEQNLVQVGLCHQDEIFYNEDSSTLPMILEKPGAKYTEVDNFENYVKDTLEIVCISDNKKILESIARRLRFPFSFGNTVNIYRSRFYQQINYLECRKSSSSKGKALKKLLKYFKLKEINALVAGDWYNDITLFNTDAVKVALKNSIPRLKKNADIILKKTNDEGALQDILEKIIELNS